jgi:hypothetical protein
VNTRNRKPPGLGWELKKLGTCCKKRGPALLLTSTKIFKKYHKKYHMIVVYQTLDKSVVQKYCCGNKKFNHHHKIR